LYLLSHCYFGLASTWRTTGGLFAGEVVEKFKNYSVSVTSNVADEDKSNWLFSEANLNFPEWLRLKI
jgi:hypothetical protein